MTTDRTPEPSRGTICVCGMAKSYHQRLALVVHKYEPRYPARRLTPSAPPSTGAPSRIDRSVLEAARMDVEGGYIQQPDRTGQGYWRKIANRYNELAAFPSESPSDPERHV